MSRQTRPLEAVFVLSSISVVISCLGWTFYTPDPLAFATIVYHAVIGLAHLRAKSTSVGVNENGTESCLIAAVAYVHDVWMNVWRSAVAVDAVRLEVDGTSGNEEGEILLTEHHQEPRECLHPTATLTSLVVVCLLVVAWSMLLGLAMAFAVVQSRLWLNVGLWIELSAEVVVLVAIARICKRIRNDFFVQVERVGTLEGGEKAAVRDGVCP
jgi:hypothetical protein